MISVQYFHKQAICFLILALTATFCILPLILHASLPQSQDMTYHIFQATQFIQNLNSGVLYPRWAGGAVNGYGSPNFIFYSPMSYYFVALIHLLVPSLIYSMAIAIWFSFMLSGVTMFLLVNHFCLGYRSLVPAVFYQILPFHLYELYLRGSFAALFAYIWFPLIFLLLYKIIDSKKPAIYMICLSFAYAALIMTHLASAFMFSLIVAVILLCFLILRQTRNFMKSICAFGCGLGLSSIYFIPVLLERKYVHIDYLINGPWGKYVDNFLFTANTLHGDFSQVSHFYMLLHLGVIADIVLFGLILSFVKKRGFYRHKLLYVAFTLLFLMSLFLTIPLSKPITYVLPGISTLLFPWRWVVIMEVALAFLSGYMFTRDLNGRISSELIHRVSCFVIYIILAAVIIGTSSMLADKNIIKINSIQFNYNMSPGIENIPVWAHNWLELYYGLPPEPVSFVSGNGTYSIKLWEPQRREVMCESSAPSKVRISTFYYPGWEIILDGNNVLPDLEKNSGAILIDIPEGEHNILLQFASTPLRRFAKWASLFILLLLIVVALPLSKKEF